LWKQFLVIFFKEFEIFENFVILLAKISD